MTKQVDEQPEGKNDLFHIVAWGLAFLAVSTLWILFGWISFFFPLFVFVYIQKYGWQKTNKCLAAGLLLAIIAGLVTQSTEFVLYIAGFLPVGYISAHSAQLEEKPWKAGLKGWLALCILFFIFFSVLFSGSEVSFFQTTTEALDAIENEILRQYSQSGTLSAEKYEILESTMLQAKQTAPLILPAIFGSVFLLVVWATIVLGNTILPRLGSSPPWPAYRYWELPEKLVWGFIVSALVSAFSSGVLQIIGINCIILIALVYSFQGLAIVVYYLDKLDVPKFFRAVIYIMIILQSFGSILLAIAGIADVWFDIRRIKQSHNNRKSDAE